MGAPRGLPRAVDALHALRRPARRPVAAHDAARDRGRPRRRAIRGVRDADVRDVRADVPAAVRPVRRALPQGPGRLGFPVPLDDHREDLRHAPGAAAGRDALEPRGVRHRPGLRADADPDARPPARRGARVRRPDARRAPQGDPRVPQARRPPRPRRRLVPVPGRDARGDRRGHGEVHRGRRAGPPRGRHAHRLRPARRGEGGRRGDVRVVGPARRPAAVARALDERGRARRGAARLRRRARQPAAQARSRVRTHRLPVRRAVRLRRVPRPPAPPPAHARVAAPLAPSTGSTPRRSSPTPA